MDEKFCGKCSRKLSITTHFCLSCIRELERKPTKDRVSTSNFNQLYNEYLSILETHPILFSELAISTSKFLRLVRKMKNEFLNIHVFKFKRHKMEGIVYKDNQREKAAIRLKNLYPDLRLPKFLKIS